MKSNVGTCFRCSTLSGRSDCHVATVVQLVYLGAEKSSTLFVLPSAKFTIQANTLIAMPYLARPKSNWKR